MSQLDDLLLYAGDARHVTALVSRDKRLLRLELAVPPPMTTWRLAVKDAAKADQWLAPAGWPLLQHPPVTIFLVHFFTNIGCQGDP